MRDIWLTGTALTAAMVVSWSMATFAKPTSEIGESAPSVTSSPFEIMAARQRFSLPVDYCTRSF